MSGHPFHRTIRRRLIAVVMATCTIATADASAAPQIIGIAAAILNDVRITSAASSQFRPATLRQRVALADRVRTGQRSQLQMLLLDKSLFTIGANAQLTIDRYVYDPNGGRYFSASVAKGAFRFMSGSPDRKGTSSIHTPVATIGIRGTIVEGVIGEDAVSIMKGERGAGRGIGGDPAVASLIILRGPGPQRQGNATVGEITVANGGQTVTLDRPLLAVYVPEVGAAPIGPFTISLPGLGRLHDLIFPMFQEWRASPAPSTDQPIYPYRVRKSIPEMPVPYREESSPPPQYQGPGWPQLPNVRPSQRPSRGTATTDKTPRQSPPNTSSASPYQPPPNASSDSPNSQPPASSPNLKSGR